MFAKHNRVTMTSHVHICLWASITKFGSIVLDDSLNLLVNSNPIWNLESDLLQGKDGPSINSVRMFMSLNWSTRT